MTSYHFRTSPQYSLAYFLPLRHPEASLCGAIYISSQWIRITNHANSVLKVSSLLQVVG